MGLRRYQSMRDFGQTPEPRGKKAAAGQASRFVIQKHEARRLHYDFRLEMGGVLVSWAVPKGLPTNHGERRLAVHVEDHPLDYENFEGIIPENNYGAGTVMVWDRGHYLTAENPHKMLARGKLDIILLGEKLRGDWTLVRTKSFAGGKDSWLAIKRKEDARAVSKQEDDRSVLTGRTMRQIREQRKRLWQGRPKKIASSSAARAKVSPRSLRGKKAVFVEPMKALLVSEVPRGEKWVYEIKFDGIRAIAVRNGSRVQLFTRNNIDRAARHPSLVEALAELPASRFVLDGELVALDAKGRSSFQLFQETLDPARAGEAPLHYYLFDVPQLEGEDLSHEPLIRRKETLQTLLAGMADPLRYSGHVAGNAKEILRQVVKLGLEGIIAKRADSRYESGRRSGAWVKWKTHQRQEFVIGGYTRPKGNRNHFGALLVGYYQDKTLRFASKVGTGFNAALLRTLFEKFRGLVSAACPFAGLPEQTRSGAGLTAAEMRLCTWLKPKLVAEVKFQEWTRDGHLRQPVFLGLREDKKPEEVKRESPA